jgi:hypothetical protein
MEWTHVGDCERYGRIYGVQGRDDSASVLTLCRTEHETLVHIMSPWFQPTLLGTARQEFPSNIRPIQGQGKWS